MTDKRIKPRMHRRIPLKVGLRLSGAAAGEGQILEMSEGGLSFAAAFVVPTGARLTAEVSDAEATLRLSGEIAHATARENDVVYGLRFEKLAAADAEAVRALLKRHRFSAFRVSHQG